MRRALATSQLEEAQPFYRQLESNTRGDMIHGIWQKFVRDGYESAVASDIAASQVHNTIAACNDYVEALDYEWLKITDWYAPGSTRPSGASATALYANHLAAVWNQGDASA